MRTTNSLFNVPYFALGAELSHDYHERTSISGLRAALALGGTLVAAAMSFALFFPNTDPGVDPKFNVAGYQIMGLTFGALMMISGLLATFGTLSYRHKLAPATRSIKQSPGVYRSILLAFRNPSFLMLIISIALFFLASVVNATTAIHYLTYYAQLTTSQALSLFQLSFFVGAVSGIPAWLWIGRRVDKHWIYFWATVALALVMAAAYFLIGEQRLFGVGNLAVLVGGNFVAGLFAGAIWTMPASMIADIADQDEVMTGQRREGVFFGVFSFAQQMAASVAVLLTGILLDHYVGLVPGQLEQSPTTIDRIAIVFGPFAGTLLLVAAFFVLGYRLNQRRVREIQSALAQSHGAVPYDPTD